MTITLEEFEKQLESGLKRISDCELKEMKIFQKDLSEVTFHNVIFSDVAFLECNLSDVFFSDCHLASTDINACNCTEAVFYNNADKPVTAGCGIKDSTVKNTILSGTLFHTGISGTSFVDVTWAEAELVESRFDNCKIHNCQLDNSNLEKVFLNAEVSDTSFTGCNLRGMFFGNSVLKNSSFAEADFEKATLEQTAFNECNLTGAKNLNGQILPSGAATSEKEGNIKKINKGSEQTEKKLSGDIVRKINLMKKDGTPMRVCPNGQVYIDPAHLKYFKRSEIYDIEKYYENKYGKAFKPDSSIAALPDKLRKKIELMEAGDVHITKMPDGRVRVPLLQLRYFTNDDISILNSFYINQVKELQPAKQEFPFSENINKKLHILQSKGTPLRVCPNGQVVIPEGELRYFKTAELKELNKYYSDKAIETFRPSATVKSLPKTLVEKLKNMEQETGKKLLVTKAGKAMLPISELNHFSDSEISCLNSFYMNSANVEKLHTAAAYAAEP